MPSRAFLFFPRGRCSACYFYVDASLNALAGIFVFSTRLLALLVALLLVAVSMPSRAFLFFPRQ